METAHATRSRTVVSVLEELAVRRNEVAEARRAGRDRDADESAACVLALERELATMVGGGSGADGRSRVGYPRRRGVRRRTFS